MKKTVKIKDWELMKEQFGVDDDGDINCDWMFTDVMESLLPPNRIIEVDCRDGQFYWNRGVGRVYILTEDVIEKYYDGHSRNYNLNRLIDDRTDQFEKELKDLCIRYEVNCITQTFEQE